jgi:hypothetical protein
MDLVCYRSQAGQMSAETCEKTEPSGAGHDV